MLQARIFLPVKPLILSAGKKNCRGFPVQTSDCVNLPAVYRSRGIYEMDIINHPLAGGPFLQIINIIQEHHGYR
jgi:hypothetical protein